MSDRKILFEGFVSFVGIYKERLIIKHTVALFNDYKEAKSDILLELFPCASETSDICEEIVKYLEEETDIIEWFNELS